MSIGCILSLCVVCSIQNYKVACIHILAYHPIFPRLLKDFFSSIVGSKMWKVCFPGGISRSHKFTHRPPEKQSLHIVSTDYTS